MNSQGTRLPIQPSGRRPAGPAATRASRIASSAFAPGHRFALGTAPAVSRRQVLSRDDEPTRPGTADFLRQSLPVVRPGRRLSEPDRQRVVFADDAALAASQRLSRVCRSARGPAPGSGAGSGSTWSPPSERRRAPAACASSGRTPLRVERRPAGRASSPAERGRPAWSADASPTEDTRPPIRHPGA